MIYDKDKTIEEQIKILTEILQTKLIQILKPLEKYSKENNPFILYSRLKYQLKHF